MFIYFDVDSTLCSVEGCDRLATRQGVGKHVAELTAATMNGSRPFDEVFITKTQLISPSRVDFADLAAYYQDHLVPEMKELIHDLQGDGHTIGILSQGYREAILPVTNLLHIAPEHVHALVFDHTEDGAYSGFPEQPLKYENGKSVILWEVKKQYPDEKIIFIGDSVGDLIAGQQADRFIGCGITIIRDKVRQESAYFVTSIEQLRKEIYL